MFRQQLARPAVAPVGRAAGIRRIEDERRHMRSSLTGFGLAILRRALCEQLSFCNRRAAKSTISKKNVLGRNGLGDGLGARSRSQTTEAMAVPSIDVREARMSDG
jgi:hypothetical protein